MTNDIIRMIEIIITHGFNEKKKQNIFTFLASK